MEEVRLEDGRGGEGSEREQVEVEESQVKEIRVEDSEGGKWSGWERK